MIAIKTLQKRLDRLEERPTAEPDIVEMVLAALEDADLELLQEISILRESGFNEEQIASMMGDRYQEAQETVVQFQKVYQGKLDVLRQRERDHGL
jgi:hypothetical protein